MFGVRCPGVLPTDLRRAAVSYLEASAADSADVEPWQGFEVSQHGQ